MTFVYPGMNVRLVNPRTVAGQNPMTAGREKEEEGPPIY